MFTNLINAWSNLLFATPLSTMLTYVVGTTLTFFVTYIMYVAIMHVKKVRKEWLKQGKDFVPLVKGMFYVALVIGWLLDLALNVFLMSVLLFQVPTKFTVTSRIRRNLERYANSQTFLGRYRYKICHWLCVNMLEPFDIGHCLPD